MKQEPCSKEPTELDRLKLLPLQVAVTQHKLGLMDDLTLTCMSAVVAESLGHKVFPDEE